MSREDAHYKARLKNPKIENDIAEYHRKRIEASKITPPEKGKMNFEQGITGTGI